MKPIVLLAAGALALMALGKKGSTSQSNGGGNGGGGGGGGGGNGDGNGDGGSTGNGDLDLGNYLSEPGAPVPGTFYPVSAVDVAGGIRGIASQAIFGTRTMTAAATTTYAVCINDSDWNGWLYGEGSDAMWAASGVSATMALQPINADALFAIRNRYWPVPYGAVLTALAAGTVAPPQPTGKYGLLWLPPAELTTNPEFPGQAGTIECPIGTWAGGRSTKDPPTVVLNELTGPSPDWMPSTGGPSL